MMQPPAVKPGYWTHGELPANVRLGPNSVITGDYVTGDLTFKRFRSERDPGLIVGAGCTLDGVLFNVGPQGRIEIGDHCYFQETLLVSELDICIGTRVVIGWHATIVDADFHPIDPRERISDTIACSPLGGGRPRRPFTCRPVVIEDDVLIGPTSAILKGVRVGIGAVVEAGAVVVHDVPPHSRVLGNPARVIGQV
jgi:acetyltransferase-like isoleucine patch superfamily enzyme